MLYFFTIQIISIIIITTNIYLITRPAITKMLEHEGLVYTFMYVNYFYDSDQPQFKSKHFVHTFTIGHRRTTPKPLAQV